LFQDLLLTGLTPGVTNSSTPKKLFLSRSQEDFTV